ncbi:MAG: hypothetical protein RL531_1348 [Actinomycetota bacterium]
MANHGGEQRGAPIALIASGGAFVALVVFILQNTQQAEVHFLWLNVTWGIWFVIVVSMLLGAVIGWGFRFWRRRKD